MEENSSEGVVVGFITDAEGNWEYFERCVALSRVVRFNASGELEFCRASHADIFVFGGDTCDKGNGDLRIIEALVAFKDRHVERVHLLAGNRDLNKIRLSSELRETDIDVPWPLPLPHGTRRGLPLREYLTKLNGGNGEDLSPVNTQANRLRWILDTSMGAQGMFELRRAELRLLRGIDISDDDVVQSYLQSIESDTGCLWRYLQHAEMGFQWGDTLFIHGGLPDGAPGWLPTLSWRYEEPEATDQCLGELLPEDHSLQDWITAMTVRLNEGLADYRARPYWGEDRQRGGEMVMSWQSTPALFGRSVIVESALSQGTPKPMSPQVSKYLIDHGVRRVVSGHKPCGDSPFVLRELPEVVCCDTTYSDQKAHDKRGAALAAVEFEGVPERSYSIVRGTLCDGSNFEFRLAPPGSDGTQNGCDPYVGRCTVDGWWVKAPLADGQYHCAQSPPESRDVSYKRILASEMTF